MKSQGVYIIGQKFSKLLVLELFEESRKVSNKYRVQPIYKCLCDCGNICYIKKGAITQGKTTSCGCNRSQHGNKSAAWKGFGEISQSSWAQILRHARDRNLEVTVTIEDVWGLFLKQDRKCKLSNLELTFSRSRNIAGATASLDRIDSSKGYDSDNIQWVHKDINRMKFDLPQEDFIKYCKAIASNIP